MRKLNSNQRYLAISVLLSVTLILIGYFVNNSPLFTGEDLNQYYLTQKLCEFLNLPSTKTEGEDDVSFINVSYDKELIAAPAGLGNAVITDRGKLCELLKLLKENGQYKYIILDIIFDENDISPNDSSLYSLIESMDNIIVIRDDSIQAPPQRLTDKSALATYYSTITATNFIRYQYQNRDAIPYIPLKVYEDLHPGIKLKRHGWKYLPIYTFGRKLCHNSSFITFDSKHFAKNSTTDFNESYVTNFEYENLGIDITNRQYRDKEDKMRTISRISNDKYIIIGDFTKDLHDTYMGVRPGPYIIYRALKSLENGKHLISFWRELYWFIVYAVILWWILTGQKISNIVPPKVKKIKFCKYLSKKKFLRFISSLIGYSVFLLIFSTVEYIVIGNVNSIIIPLYVCMFTKLYYDYKNFRLS